MEYQVPLEPPFNIMIAAGNDLVILVFWRKQSFGEMHVLHMSQ